MPDTYRINGQLYDIDFSHNGATAVLRNGEVTHEWRIERIDDHRVLIHDGHATHTALMVRDGGSIFVHVAGEHYVVEAVEGQARFQPGGDSGAGGNLIGAPMPGKILKIFVEEGQDVKKNERLFIVEAMKMENEVKAPRDGRIAAVNFAVLDLVSVGQAVIELEEKEPA